MSKDQEVLPKKTRNLLILAALILPLFTYSLAYFFGSVEGITNLDGSIASRDEVLGSMLKTLYFSLPFLAFLLGLLVALIPYKEAAYKDKILRSVLLVLVILQAIFFIPTVLGTLANGVF